jgi:hypothetical protein
LTQYKSSNVMAETVQRKAHGSLFKQISIKEEERDMRNGTTDRYQGSHQSVDQNSCRSEGNCKRSPRITEDAPVGQELERE